MADLDQLKNALEIAPVDRKVKHEAWVAFGAAADPSDFDKRMRALKLPQSTFDQLHDLKYPPPPGSKQQFGPSGQPANAFPQGKLTGKDILATGVEALPMAGGVVGGAIGSVPGAGLGGMAGEAAREAIVTRAGADNLSGPTVKVEPPPGSLPDMGTKLVEQGVTQAAFEGGGELVASAVRGTTGGAMHGAITPEAQADAKAIEAAEKNAAVREVSDKAGLGLTAAQIAGNSTRTGRLLNTVQKFGEYGIFSQKFIRAAREAGVEKALDWVNDGLSKLHAPSSPLATGEDVRGQFRESYRIFQDTAHQFYSALDKAASNVSVNVQGMKQWALKALVESERAKKLHPGTGGLGGAAEKILNDAAQQPDTMTFSQAQNWRSKLGQVTPQPDELAANQAEGIAKQAYKQLSSAMDNSAGALNPRAQKLWKVVNQFYKDGMEIFDTKMVNNLMDQDRGPEMIAAAIKNGDVSMATRIRRAVLDHPMRYGYPADKVASQETWRHFQEQFTRSRILDSPESVPSKVLQNAPPGATPPTAKVSPLTVKDVLSNAAGMQRRIHDLGPGVIDAVYADPAVGGTKAQRGYGGREVIKNINDLSEAFARIERLPAEGERKIYAAINIALAGLGAGIGHSIGGIEGTAIGAAGAEFLPYMISKVVNSPRATAYFLDGLGGLVSSLPPKGATNLVARGVRAAGEGLKIGQEHSVTSPESFKLGGKVMADFGRALAIVEKEEAKRKEALEKAADGIDLNPYQVQHEMETPVQASNPYE